MADDAVKVAIRVRPLVSIERAQDCVSVVSYPGPSQIQLAGAHTFTYDYLYSETSTQAEVYETCVAPLVKQFFLGYNATILAYGQTGSGKTHTMGTSSSAGKSSEELGIVPRVVHELFDLMKSRDETHTYVLHTQFIEVYQDDIFDLLCTIPRGRADRPIPQIKEGRGDRIEVENVTKLDSKCAEDCLDALERGSASRVTGSTNMNAASSRSHAIFTLQLSQKVRESDDLGVSNDEFITSKFHFVDLAGSERLKRTGAVGDRMKEGIQINQGLLALGNVISALGDPTRRGGHVPFRDSKITRLLQDSLGGNSKTLMVANCSPSESNREETLNTLQYANRAKNIKNKAVINRDPMSQKLDLLRGRIKELEAELDVYRSGNIPTQEQRAQFAALGESIAAGGGVVGGGGVGSTSGTGATNSPFPGHSPSTSFHHLPPMHQHQRIGSALELPPMIGIDEIIVKADDWAVTKEQLVHHETELRKMHQRNAKLRQDLNTKNDEKLRVACVRDAWRRKVELLAETFPDVKTMLEKEKEELKNEKSSTNNNNNNNKEDETTNNNGVTPTEDANESENIATDATSTPPTTTIGAGAASSSVTASLLVESGPEDDENDYGLYSVLAPGSTSNSFNSDCHILAEKNLLLSKLSRRYRSQKFELRETRLHLERSRKKVLILKNQVRHMKRSQENGGGHHHQQHEQQDEDGMFNAGGGESLDHSRDESAPEDDEEEDNATHGSDEPFTRKRTHSASVSRIDLGAAGISSSVGGVGVVGSPDSVGSTDLLSPNLPGGVDVLLSPSDLEDLEYASPFEKEDEDIESLNTLAQLKEQEHAKQKRLLQDEQSYLSEEITRKEIFLEQLSEEKKRTLVQQKIYQTYIDDLERDRQQASDRIVELEKLMASKPMSETNTHGGLNSDQSRELANSRAQLKKASDELKVYREKLRASHESQKRQHAADEARIKLLTSEIDRAKKARVDVARKLDESSGKYKDWVTNYENKMKLMQKNQRKSEMEVRTLNEQLSQQAIQLKRAREANNVLKSKVRDQDSATAAAAARAKKAATKKASSSSSSSKPSGVVFGNYNSNASDSRLKARTGKEHRRKLTKDGGLMGLPPTGKSELNTANGIERLTRDFNTFLYHEVQRATLQRDVDNFRTQVEHYKYAMEESIDALASAPDDITPEEQLLLETNHSTNEISHRASLKSLHDAETMLREMNEAAAAAAGAASSSSSSSSSIGFEDRLATRFKHVLQEPPKRLLAIVCKAMVDLSVANGIQQRPDGNAGTLLGGSNTYHFDDGAPLSSLVQMVGSNNGADLSGSSTFRRGSESMASQGTIGASAPHSLTSSPNFKSSHRASLPTNASGLASPSKGNNARKSAVQPSSTLAPPQQQQPQQQPAGVVSSHPSWIGLSPLQAYLVQPNGIAMITKPNFDTNGDEELIALPPAIEIPQEEADQAHGGKVLHNNFTVDSTDDADDGELSSKPKVDRTSSSSTTSSSHPSSKSSKLVFDRLTDPSNFTGTSKHLLHGPGPQTARTTAAAAAGRSGATLATTGGAQANAQTNSVPPINTANLSTAFVGGNAGKGKLLSSGLLRAPDRSPSPGGWTDDGSSTPLASSSGSNSTLPSAASGVASAPPPAASSARAVPFHERLSDPKSYTGAQRAKFAEGINSKRSALPMNQQPTTKEKEREEGFILGTSSRGSILQRHSLERSESSESSIASHGHVSSSTSTPISLEGSILGDHHPATTGAAAERPPTHTRHRSLTAPAPMQTQTPAATLAAGAAASDEDVNKENLDTAPTTNKPTRSRKGSRIEIDENDETIEIE